VIYIIPHAGLWCYSDNRMESVALLWVVRRTGRVHTVRARF